MLYVINEVYWHMRYPSNQRKCRGKILDDFRSRRYEAVHLSIRPAPSMPLLYSLNTWGKRTKDLELELFSLLWTNNMSLIPSRADDKSSTGRLLIHFQTIVLPEKSSLHSPLFIYWLLIIFDICFLLDQTVQIS